MSIRRARPGRPRLVPTKSTTHPRDQVLHAAAHLFVTKGFAATSTREIADRVGIRQASLYYHFANKDEILGELLQRSVRPTVDMVDRIDQLTAAEAPETGLYLLALVDIHTLARAPDNIGALANHPDVVSSGAYEALHNTHADLAATYARMAARAAPSDLPDSAEPPHRGEILMHLVEAVTTLRGLGLSIEPTLTAGIADTCLRLCGIPEERIRLAAAAAGRLIATLEPSAGSEEHDGPTPEQPRRRH